MKTYCARIVPLLLFLVAPPPASAESQSRLALIDLIIQDFTSRLGITQDVTFALVVGNPRLVSVERVPDARTELFQLSFEEDFLTTLDNRDLCAAIAHELGHIWIFTHFPYLHTEALANEHALKLVSREDLDNIYRKAQLWKRENRPTTLAVDSTNPIQQTIP